ncbi:MAG: phage portal protein [Lachnospiraceae bacterium]|nr:phage portal protein [Lachnospiraceae bacterium]
MGWLSNLFKKQSNNITTGKYAEVMNGYAPIFTQFGTNIYASDVVQQAINCIVSEMKKLRPEHIREIGNDIVPVSNSGIQAVLNNPNPLMTQSDFLEKVTWLLFLNYNAFIIPTYYEWKDEKGVVRRKYDGLYPIQPTQVDFIEDAAGKLFVKLRFNNGQEFIIKYSDVIHLKYRYSVNQYMGGNEAGQPDNEALLTTLNINHQLLQGVASAMKSSFAINGVVKYNTMLDEGKTEAALKELESKLKKSESGFLPLDLKAEFIPIKKDLQLVDAGTLKFIDEKILRQFGVPLAILTGDYTKAQYEAFYQKTLEPLIISFSQAFTKVLLTEGEISHHNKIKFYPKDLIFMSVDQTLQMVTLLSNTGALYENEKRVAFGLRPLAELEGKRYMSLNWVDAEKANQYQVGTND